jgi:predicted nucleotidyltransferase
MGTTYLDEALPGTALFGKARRAILALLYGHADELFYVREIARAAGVGHGAVQRELRALVAAGVLNRTQRGQQVFYQANQASPIYTELRGLVQKTFGAAEVLRRCLQRLRPRIRVALVFGSLAHGREAKDSDVDLLIVGRVTLAQVSSALSAAEETLRREISPVVYPAPELRAKLAAHHPFLTAVLRGPKLFVIGDERDLARLACQRLADFPAGQP